MEGVPVQCRSENVHRHGPDRCLRSRGSPKRLGQPSQEYNPGHTRSRRRCSNPSIHPATTSLHNARTVHSHLDRLRSGDVQVGERNYEQYRASREKAPDPFTQTELHSIREFESRQKQMDEMRERKRAEMHVRNQNYFDRMKQMVITEGVDQNQKKITY